MSVGLCLVTHDHIGDTLLKAATAMLGTCPLPAVSVQVTSSCDPARVEGILRQVREAVRKLDDGSGVLILTDMYGSTPANIATALSNDSSDVVVIAGLNLPMLVRLLNYPGLTLAQLADKAVSGGQEGIFRCGGDGDF